MRILQDQNVFIFEEVVKKSKFITYIGTVTTKEELDAFIKKYSKSDARHNCWAYKIGFENIVYGYNNDGEPTGTAGEPLLKLININDITNIVIFCVRYFGGIKLGTGGLQRAYSSGAIHLLKTTKLREVEELYAVEIKFELAKMKFITNSLSNFEIKDLKKYFHEQEVVFSFKIKDLDKLEAIKTTCKIIKKHKTFF